MSWEQSPCSWGFINSAFIRSSFLFIKVPFLGVMCHFCPREKEGVCRSVVAAYFHAASSQKNRWYSALSDAPLPLLGGWFRFRLKLHRLRPLSNFDWHQPSEFKTVGFVEPKHPSLPYPHLPFDLPQSSCRYHLTKARLQIQYMFAVEGLFRVVFFALVLSVKLHLMTSVVSFLIWASMWWPISCWSTKENSRKIFRFP